MRALTSPRHAHKMNLTDEKKGGTLTEAKGTRNMTRGGYRRVIVNFAAPLFLSMLFQQLYNTVDSLVVGHFLGTESLAAVSSSGSLIMLLVGFFTGATMGAGVVVARYFGAEDYDKVSRAVHTNIALGLVTGVAVSVFGVLMTPHILRWMGTDPAVLPESIKYFRAYFYGVIAVVMYNICKGIMNAVGDSRRPLYYLIFSSVLNVVLDVVFVGWLGLGVEWAAIATVIAQAASVALCLIYLTRPGTVFAVSFKKLRFHKDMLGQIVRYGLPTGIQNSVISFANVLVQTNINSFGQEAMAACGAYSKLEGFVFLPIMSLSMALTTFISQNLGAGKHERARQGARFGILSCVIMAELIGLALFLFAPAFVGLFSDDPAVIAIGVQQARTEALFFCLLAFSHCVAGICRGAGRSVVPMVIMFSVWCVLRVIYITVAMSVSHDIQLLFIAYPLTWSISSIIYFIYYKKSNWIHGFDAEIAPVAD